jgi:hypothetical protein
MIDLTGKRFGMLTVLRREGAALQPSGNTAPTWLTKCDCGRMKVVRGVNLRSKGTASCGCTQTRHGMFGTPEYSAWSAMLYRCTNPQAGNWKDYGGRGISVCPAWMGDGGFQSFFRRVGARPSKRHSLDRIDNMGNYEPTNVRWATPCQQARNKRTSRALVVDGVSRSVAEWAEAMGLGRSTSR